jgi:HlyD family secretion protein
MFVCGMSHKLKIILGTAVFLLLAGASRLFIVAQEPAAPAPSHAFVTVERGDLQMSVSATGALSPLITILVGSQVSGIIDKVYADFNSQVHAGDVIAQIEPSLFNAQVAQAKANFDRAVAAQEKVSVEIEEAQRELARVTRLRQSSVMTESEADAAHFRYQAVVVEHKVKKAEVAQAKAALEQEQVNLANTTIYAPIDGVVLSRDVAVGQTVAASLQAPTLFTIAQDLRQMQIDTSVDEAFIGMIREGQSVRFTVFAYPKQVFEGEVGQIRLNPTVESEVVLYNCIIHVDNAALKLKPGMTATVTIEVDRRVNVFKVPNAALRYVPDLPPERLTALRKELSLSDNEAIIWTLAKDGVKPLKVSVGLTSDRETEISAQGLTVSTRVVIPSNSKIPTRKRNTGVRLF